MPIPQQTPAEIADIIVSRIITANDPTALFDETGSLDPLLISSVAACGKASIDGFYNRLKKAFPKDFPASQWRDRIREENGTTRLRIVKDDDVTAELPQIHTVDRPLRDVTKDAIQAIRQANNPPATFVRAGEMVHISKDENDRPSIKISDEFRVRSDFTKAADWLKPGKDGAIHVSPPIDVVRDVMAQNPADWGLPPLMGVTEIPTMRADGTVLSKHGYDRGSGLFYEPSNLRNIPVHDEPTQQDVKAAVDLIEEAIGEFPYDSLASRANVYALLLTPILRPAISGCTPLAVIDAPQAGTGKSLLVDVLSMITIGRAGSMTPYPYKGEEMQKQIASCLIAGTPLICFDNLEGDLKSPELALAITAKEYQCRILGFTKNMMVPNLSTWIVTGNNVKPGGDMPRRCYQIRLDAQNSKPFQGRKFRHQDLLGWVADHRAELLHALLTIARYWYSRGAKNLIDNPLGSFESWHRVIGSILLSCHVKGFLDNFDVFVEEEDESPREWESYLLAIMDEFPGEKDWCSRYFIVSEVMSSMSSDMSKLKHEVPAEIADALVRAKKPNIVVGQMFQKRRNRRFGFGAVSVWLDREPVEDKSDHKGSARWRVVKKMAVVE